MALIEVDTPNGPRKVRVCNYYRTVCIPSGSYCSSRCYHQDQKRITAAADSLVAKLNEMELRKDGAKQ